MLLVKKDIKRPPELQLALDALRLGNGLQRMPLRLRPRDQRPRRVAAVLLVPAAERVELGLDVATVARRRARAGVARLEQRHRRRARVGVAALEDVVRGDDACKACADNGNVDLRGHGGGGAEACQTVRLREPVRSGRVRDGREIHDVE